MEKKISPVRVFRYAGAYIAFEIGSGFATGQEIMQFYTSYGLWSLGAALISMLLFSWAGSRIMVMGYERGSDLQRPYQLICGRIPGIFFEFFVMIYLFGVLAVMLSGAGAGLQNCCGISHRTGSSVMALAIFLAAALGLEKLIGLVGAAGPVIIAGILLVSVWTLVSKGGITPEKAAWTADITQLRPAGSWAVSGILYPAYNLVSSVPFLMALGKDAASAKEAAAGGITGGCLLMITVIFVDLAFLASPETAGSQVPSLDLAEAVSPEMEAVFMAVLLAGIFSTAAPVLWTICSALAPDGGKASVLIALLVSIDALILGQMPFDELVGMIYPYTGYVGLILIACIAVRDRFAMSGPPEKTLKKSRGRYM
ncbi:MAG: hypothetical protein ACI4LA_04490 [Emergencia sp.]